MTSVYNYNTLIAVRFRSVSFALFEMVFCSVVDRTYHSKLSMSEQMSFAEDVRYLFVFYSRLPRGQNETCSHCGFYCMFSIKVANHMWPMLRAKKRTRKKTTHTPDPSFVFHFSCISHIIPSDKPLISFHFQNVCASFFALAPLARLYFTQRYRIHIFYWSVCCASSFFLKVRSFHGYVHWWAKWK